MLSLMLHSREVSHMLGLQVVRKRLNKPMTLAEKVRFADIIARLPHANVAAFWSNP